MKKVLLLVDTGSIMHNLKVTYSKPKLNYKAWMEDCLGEDIMHTAIAYGLMPAGDTATPFTTWLASSGFQCKFRSIIKAGEKLILRSPNVLMAIDAMKLILAPNSKVDKVIIGSANPEISDLVSAIRQQGIECVVSCANACKALRNAATAIHEIEENFILGDVESV